MLQTISHSSFVLFCLPCELYALMSIIIMTVITGMPSNLRPTTRECVHLVTRAHFRSCDKDGRHIVLSDVAENPTLHASFMVVSSIEPELLTGEDCRKSDL